LVFDLAGTMLAVKRADHAQQQLRINRLAFRQRLHDLYVDAKNRILDPTRRDLEPQVGDRTFIPGTIRQFDEENRRVPSS
jgi:hypothetical protein